MPEKMTQEALERITHQSEAGGAIWLNGAVKRLLAHLAALVAERDEAQRKVACSMGVGSGEGSLFVHGDYESIKAAQAIVLERNSLYARVQTLVAERGAEAGEVLEVRPEGDARTWKEAYRLERAAREGWVAAHQKDTDALRERARALEAEKREFSDWEKVVDADHAALYQRIRTLRAQRTDAQALHEATESRLAAILQKAGSRGAVDRGLHRYEASIKAEFGRLSAVADAVGEAINYVVSEDVTGAAVPLHPNGKCTCCGEGQCEWCSRMRCVGCGKDGVALCPSCEAGARRSQDAAPEISTPETPEALSSRVRLELLDNMLEQVRQPDEPAAALERLIRQRNPNAHEPSTVEAFATVRDALREGYDAGENAPGEHALSLLERRMGAMGRVMALLAPVIDRWTPGKDMGLTDETEAAPLVAAFHAAITDAPDVFTLEEVDAATNKPNWHRFPTRSDEYQDGYEAALSDVRARLTALRR